jgi:hypothetical protein
LKNKKFIKKRADINHVGPIQKVEYEISFEVPDYAFVLIIQTIKLNFNKDFRIKIILISEYQY